jgi:glycogen operon protein
MADEDWNNPGARSLGLRLAGDAMAEVDARGNRIADDTLLILLNAHHEPLTFVLPAHRAKVRWEVLLDTRESTGVRRHRLLRGGEAYDLEARSLALLRLRRDVSATTSIGEEFSTPRNMPVNGQYREQM